MDSRIPLCDLHCTLADVIDVATHERGLPRKCELRVAFGECLLCLLVMSDVAGHAKQRHGNALRIAHNCALSGEPARLTGMWVVRWRHHSILNIQDLTGASRLCHGSIYANEVIGTNEAPHLFDCLGRHVVSVKLRGTCIT